MFKVFHFLDLNKQMPMRKTAGLEEFIYKNLCDYSFSLANCVNASCFNKWGVPGLLCFDLS